MKSCKSTTNKHSVTKPGLFTSPQTCTQKENSKRLNANFFKRPDSQMDKTKLILQSGGLANPYSLELTEKMNFRSTFKEKFVSVTPKIKSPSLLKMCEGNLSPSNHINRGSDKKFPPKSISRNDPFLKVNQKNAFDLIKNPRVSSAKNATSGKSKITFPHAPAELRLNSKPKNLSIPKSNELLVSDKFLWLDKKLNKQIKLKMPSRHDSHGVQNHQGSEDPQNFQKTIKEVEKAQTGQTNTSEEQLNSCAIDLINSEFLTEINIELLLTLFAKLLTLYCYIEQKKDTYLVIREYTEIIQCSDYMIVDNLILKTKEIGQEVIMAFKLEILSILIVFYCNIEHEGQNNSNLLKIVEKISFNFFCFLNILKKSCDQHQLTAESKSIANFLETSNAEKAFKKDIDYSKTFKKNNGALLTIILSLSKDRSSPIYNERLKMLIIGLKTYPLLKSCEKLFKFFSQIMKGKGVMMVEEAGNTQRKLSLLNQTEQEPNFILQPFNFISLLPPKVVNLPYTLVLDLDETLIHYEESEGGLGQFFLRPYAQQFIIDLKPFYEIVIFTAAMKNYADWIIDRLDTHKMISHRLYRCSTKNHNGVFIKDLSKIGRELSKTIIVDNNAENFQYQPENGIFIKSWYDDPSDTALRELSQVLISVSKKNNPDIRDGLKEMRQKMSIQSEKR
jgi:Dullard-like phosphatase family protein